MEYNYNISSQHFRHGMSTGFLGDLGDFRMLKEYSRITQDFYTFYIAELHEPNLRYAGYCNC